MLTGVGTMFDLGAATVTTLGLTSIGLINATTAVELYSAYRNKLMQRDLFMLRGAGWDSLAEADKEFVQTIPWAVLNVVMIGPPVVLEKVLAAQQAASAAKNFARVKQLDRYRRAIIAINFAINGGVAVTQVKGAIPAVKDVYRELNQKHP